jgi:hypothetical protein
MTESFRVAARPTASLYKSIPGVDPAGGKVMMTSYKR